MVVLVGLPDGGVLDFMDRFMETIQGACGLETRKRAAEMISVVPVGLPDEGVFDVLDRFMKKSRLL